MSPQQISEMRLKSDKSDIAWFFGSVLHLLLYQTYPLEQWTLPNNNHQFGRDLTKLPNFESFYMSKLQESVKELLESEGQLELRNDLPRGFQKQYALLSHIMKNALQTYSDTRTYDENGKMLKLASEF
uniref:Pkinase_fungal domain-containing protein n=1 Tax=Globodera pallida TaxID=36090 RepID=A0A183BPA3_GLOPA